MMIADTGHASGSVGLTTAAASAHARSRIRGLETVEREGGPGARPSVGDGQWPGPGL